MNADRLNKVTEEMITVKYEAPTVEFIEIPIEILTADVNILSGHPNGDDDGTDLGGLFK